MIIHDETPKGAFISKDGININIKIKPLYPNLSMGSEFVVLYIEATIDHDKANGGYNGLIMGMVDEYVNKLISGGRTHPTVIFKSIRVIQEGL